MKTLKTLTTLALLSLLFTQQGCWTLINEKKQLKAKGVELVGQMQSTQKTLSASYRKELSAWIDSHVKEQKKILDAKVEAEKAKLKLYAFSKINAERIATKSEMIKAFEAKVESAISGIKDELKQEQQAILTGSGSVEKSKDLALKLSASLAIMHKNSEEIGLSVDQKFEALYSEMDAHIESSIKPISFNDIKADAEGSQTVGDVISALKLSLVDENEIDKAMDSGYEALETLINRPSDSKLLAGGLLGRLSNPQLLAESLFEKVKAAVSGRIDTELAKLATKVSKTQNRIVSKIKTKTDSITESFLKEGGA